MTIFGVHVYLTKTQSRNKTFAATTEYWHIMNAFSSPSHQSPPVWCEPYWYTFLANRVALIDWDIIIPFLILIWSKHLNFILLYILLVQHRPGMPWGTFCLWRGGPQTRWLPGPRRGRCTHCSPVLDRRFCRWLSQAWRGCHWRTRSGPEDQEYSEGYFSSVPPNPQSKSNECKFQKVCLKMV